MTDTPTAAQPLIVNRPAEVSAAMTVADRLHAQGTALVIDSPAMYAEAGEELASIRSRWSAVEKQRVHLKEPYLEGGRRIDEFFREPLARLSDAGEVLKGKMLTFKQAEDAKAAAARQVELDRQRAERETAEAQQREAAERERVARVEAERIKAEAQAKADREVAEARAAAAAAEAAGNAQAAAEANAAAEAAEAEAATTIQEADAQANAVAVESQEQAEAAQADIDLADVAPAAPLPVSGAYSSAVSSRKSWKASEDVDKRALVIAAGKAAEAGDDTLLAYLDVNLPALNNLAKALKGAARVAGVRFHEAETLATRGGRR